MTVNEIMELTKQKRGTVEQFRGELIKYSLITNNESLDNRAFETFKNSIRYKDQEEKTWSLAMKKAIQEEYGEEMKLPFVWSPDIILKNLIWEIKNDLVNVYGNNGIIEGNDFHTIFEIIIDNFKEMSKTFDDYENSFGTDGNPITTYKCCGKDYIYYIVGKYNHITGNEDMHVFYNDGIHFNIMRCKHICGGSSNKGRIGQLRDICREKIIK